MLERDGVEMAGAAFREKVFFKEVDGQLRLASNLIGEVDSCDA